ncbi:MAG: MmgE/PrpD family protein [Planctomycetota bacterium]
MNDYLLLSADSNQARGIAEYAIRFCHGEWAGPSDAVLQRTELFHLDSVGCAIAALACRMNAPIVLRQEALEYPHPEGATCFGTATRVQPEKAVLANSAAARELDSNGTNFGFNPRTGYTRGEFGHNDFYPVADAAAQMMGWDGAQTLRAMVCLDEIRGRLAEVFGLKDHKIDHVVHGAIASAAVYGAIMGATAEQIESAIGMVVAHHIPFRAIRAGHQLSDSKGASAAISSEAAVSCMRRAMRGFVGPADIFRNPQAIFCLFEPPAEKDRSPFDLELATAGDDFAVMGMHFKLGLYEHQSAGAIQGLQDLLAAQPGLLDSPDELQRIKITIYEPAFGIIGDPAKRDPRTRQSADHSMVYIVATLLRKAYESKTHGWPELILLPADYDDDALVNETTRGLMDKIEFAHGGAEYDERYPDGIPTTISIEHRQLGESTSGLVMYPEGHARNTSGNLETLLAHKFTRLAELGVDDPAAVRARLTDLGTRTPDEILALYELPV